MRLLGQLPIHLKRGCDALHKWVEKLLYAVSLIAVESLLAQELLLVRLMT